MDFEHTTSLAQIDAPLTDLFTEEALDRAIDRAGQASAATVARYVAAPGDETDDAPASVEVAVEFFLTPSSLEIFEAHLEKQLVRISRRYARERREGRLGTLLVRSVPAGTFHQWRVARRRMDDVRSAARWTTDYSMLRGIVHQGRIGWSEWL